MEIEPTSYTIGEIIPLKHEMPTEKDIQDMASWLKQKGCILTKFEVLTLEVMRKRNKPKESWV